MRCAARLLLLFVILLAVQPFHARAADPAPTTAELISSASEVAAGSMFQLGVKFTIAPGWHIYWKDPGDSGLPTKVTFTVPDGAKVSELYWPEHERFELPGDVKGNGYSGEVLLWSDVTLPAQAAGDLPLKAQVSWLQ